MNELWIDERKFGYHYTISNQSVVLDDNNSVNNSVNAYHENLSQFEEISISTVKYLKSNNNPSDDLLYLNQALKNNSSNKNEPNSDNADIDLSDEASMN